MDQTLGSLPHESLSQVFGTMADSMHYLSYSGAPGHYIPNTYYTTQPHASSHHMHSVGPIRQDTTAQRKRPKYTRSKTGCLTCRAKKIKCDESKPNCMRCTHGQRECTWPEGVPARKKSTPRREPAVEAGLDNRPSTASSSGVSEASTPPASTHEMAPPKREPVETGMPLVSRRNSEPLLQTSLVHDPSLSRRQSVASVPSSTHGYPMHPSSHTQMLPGIPESSSSYSQHYHNSYPHLSQSYGQGTSLTLPRLNSQHHDHHSHHVRTIDHSPHAGQWNTPSLMQSVDPLEPFFPHVHERNLIRHYCHNALNLIMAFPTENPVLAANLQFILGRTRGSDSAVESLRMALLGIAAVHQSFLLSRGGVHGGQGGADEVMQVALSFQAKSRRLLDAACSTVDGAQSDAALGAAVAIVLTDIFSGGRNWYKTLNLAKRLVNMRGGPAVLLARSSHSKPESVTGVSRARLLLEIIAVYEMFGCLASGEEPTLLSPNAKSWWTDKANESDSQSYVEKVFGMSRDFVPVLAQVTGFVARVVATSLSKIQEVTEDRDSAEADNAAAAHAFYDIMQDWSSSSADLPERVKVGNRIYQHVAQILLLRDVLKVPPDDSLVQQHADTALTLCLDCGQNRMGVDLNWPVIIAGSQVFGTDRTRVLAIFETFRTQCCYEIETAEHIVLQVWQRLDEQLPRADWRSVMHDLHLNVLIL